MQIPSLLDSADAEPERMISKEIKAIFLTVFTKIYGCLTLSRLQKWGLIFLRVASPSSVSHPQLIEYSDEFSR